MATKGLNFFLNEKESNRKIPTYEELLNEVNSKHGTIDTDTDNVSVDNDIIAQEIDYQTNYTKKDLDKIADYYNINKRKKKIELVEDIVEFENNMINIEIVYKRKRMWSYIDEIKSDKYLSRYLIFD